MEEISNNDEVVSREVELLEELVAVTKESSEFQYRYTYVMFCFTIINILIAAFAVIMTMRDQATNFWDFLIAASAFGVMLVGMFWMMMRKPGWHEED